MRTVKKIWCGLVDFLSAEWLISVAHFPNGGGTITARSLLFTSWLYLFYSALNYFADPSSSWNFTLLGFRMRLVNTVWVFATILASVYTAFYARFASQWTYLARVYNEIKRVEASGVENKKALDEWKAGFMEDAEEVQLETKAMFASVIKAWGKETGVKQQFIKHTLGGETRYHNLMANVLKVCSRYADHLS